MVSTRSQNYPDDRTAQSRSHASSRRQHAATGNNSSLAAGSTHQAAAPVGIPQTSLLLQLPHELLQLLLEAAVLPGTLGPAILSAEDCHALYATCRATRAALSTIISHHVQYRVDLEWYCPDSEVAGKLQRFPKLASLRKLELSASYWGDLPGFLADQPNLGRLATVEQLRFNYEEPLQTADVASIVDACPSLKKLSLVQRSGEQFDGVSLADLGELRQLTDLSLEAGRGVMGFRVLTPLTQDLPGLDTLSVEVHMDAQNGMPIIAAMSHLRSLTVTLTEQQAELREFYTSLRALSSLTSLSLHGPAWWEAPRLQLPHAAAAAIAACTQLKRLDLQAFSVSGCADIALLASMPAVRYLKVGALEAESEVDLGRSTCCWEELVLLSSESPKQLLHLPLHSLRALSFGKEGLRWALSGTPSAPLVTELADCIKKVAELTALSIQTEQGHPTLQLELEWEDSEEHPSADCGTARMIAALTPWAHKLHHLTLDVWHVDEACVHQMAVSIPNLKHLVLEDCDIAAEAWSAMPTLEGLQDVKIVRVYMPGNEDWRTHDCLSLPEIIKFVAAATRPVRILVDDAVITAGTVDGCMELRIGNCMVDAHLVRLIVVALPQLRRLHLSGCGIRCEAWVALQSLSLLDHLCISNETSWNCGKGMRVVPQDLVAYAVTVARRVQISICEGALYPEELESCVDTVRQFTAAGGQAAHICSMAEAE